MAFKSFNCPSAQVIIFQHVEGMHIRMVNIHFCFHAGFLQILHIFQCLRIERFAITYKCIASRYPGEYTVIPYFLTRSTARLIYTISFIPVI